MNKNEMKRAALDAAYDLINLLMDIHDSEFVEEVLNAVQDGDTLTITALKYDI